MLTMDRGFVAVPLRCQIVVGGSRAVSGRVTRGVSGSMARQGRAVGSRGLAGAMLILGLLPGVAAARTAFVTNYGSNTVTRIDAATGTPGAAIPVGAKPYAVAVTPDGRTAYVADFGSNAVTPIDVTTGTPGAAIPVGTMPQALAITPDGRTVYVANSGSHDVTPIGVNSGTPGAPIPVGSAPVAVAVTPDGRTVYVANGGSNTVSRIDVATGTADAPIPVGSVPDGVAFVPDQGPAASFAALPATAGTAASFDA